MATQKAEATTKRTSVTKAPAVAKKTVKPVAKPAAKKPVKAKPVTKKPKKEPKAKVVRGFSMPQVEYQKIAEIKEACLKIGLRVKKNAVFRAGLKALDKMNGAQLKQAMAGFGKIRATRPKKP